MVRPVELLAQQRPMEIAPPKGLQLTTREAFEQAVRAYEERYLTDAQQLERIRRDLMQGDLPAEEITDELVRSYARQEARQRFIHAYTKQYLELYFPVTASMDTLGDVCDNGGFEEDFKYYEGYISLFYYGSDSCKPYRWTLPSVFTQVQMPLANRFEIVNKGNDTLVGIPMVKFGQKALRLNNKYGHVRMCSGDYGVDRIVKRFVVTEENRELTVWYALVLENPSGHYNAQPFFSIRCDVAPEFDLCFDASILNCHAYYTDTSNCRFDKIDVLDWTCHTIKIPSSAVGDTATLEITVSDCGAGAHFGYAYIDGICEPCDNSSKLGSVSLEQDPYYCAVDTPRICGSFSLPTLCHQNWILKSLEVPGYQITNLVIDPNTTSFCFNLPYSNFKNKDCIDVYVKAIFSDGNIELPAVLSNTIEVCKNTSNTTYANYYITISSCHPNKRGDDNISDDFYTVTVDLFSQTQGDEWTITRELDDPYPSETGVHKLAEGVTNATVELGPFLIQEGGWDMIIEIGPCRYREHITPPPYCSGCEDLRGLEISNVQCIPGNSGMPDQWTFDLFVPGDPNQTYDLTSLATGLHFNTKYTIGPFDVIEKCKNFQIQYGNSCSNKFRVCPPKPCSVPCDVEARMTEVACDELGTGQYYVKLDANTTLGNLCYKAWQLKPFRALILLGNLPADKTIGPLPKSKEVELSIYPCNFPSCFKMIYVPYPDTCLHPEPYTGINTVLERKEKLVIIPNPILSEEVFLHSTLSRTYFEIYNLQGKLLYMDSFEGAVYRVQYPFREGVYFLRYRNDEGEYATIKLIKF